MKMVAKSGVAKILTVLTMTASITALGATTADAQRRNRDRQPEAPAAPATPQVSRAFSTAYMPVQTAQRASDWAAMDAALPAARTAAVSEYEKYLVARADLVVGLNLNDEPRQNAAATAIIDSNGIPAADQASMYTIAAQRAYAADDYPLAASRGARAIELGSTVESIPLLVVDALVRSNQLDQAAAAARAQIARATAAGTKPAEQIYTVVARAMQEANRNAELREFIRLRLEAFPVAANFRQSSLIFLQTMEGEEDRGINIDLMRLLVAADAMSERRFYVEYVSSLAEEALPNEVLTAIAAGRAANLIPAGDATFAERETSARSNLAEDRASLPGAERRAVASPEARLATRIADAYLAYENYAKAEELYTSALGKTGADTDLINSRLGITRYRAGNNAGALAAFALVQGPQRAEVARYWEILIRSKMAPAAAPATPATPAPAAPATPN